MHKNFIFSQIPSLFQASHSSPSKVKKACFLNSNERSCIAMRLSLTSGHMKAWDAICLKGVLGDNALLCTIGHNIRLLRAFLFFILAWLWQVMRSCKPNLHAKCST